MMESRIRYSDRMNEAADNMGSFYQKCLNERHFERILEVGCSGGGVLNNVSAFSKFGVDIDAEKLQVAGLRGIFIALADAEVSIPFKNDTFDLVIATDVLEHLLKPAFAVLEINRVLKPEGYFLVHVPNEFQWRNVLNVFVNKSFITRSWFPGTSEHDYPHIRFFSATGFRKFIRQYGFRIVEDWTFLRGGSLGRLTNLQLFSPGPTLLCQPA